MFLCGDASLETQIGNLSGFDRDFVTEPEDAYIADYDPEQGFQIIEEVPGNKLNRQRTQEAIRGFVPDLETKANCSDFQGFPERVPLRNK